MATKAERIALARDYLAANPEFRLKSKKGAYDIKPSTATRLASGFRAQENAGLPYNYAAARGHISTPEHPGRKTPLAPPEVAQAYKNASKAKEAALTGETPSAPSQRVREALTPEERPRRHQRLRGRSHIPYGDNGEIYTRNTDREAEAVLRYARDLEPQGRNRITMQVFDCSASRTGDFNGWFPVFSHTWKYGGISLDDFYELLDAHGGSLEQFLIDQINGGATYNPPWGRIHHICQYEITILPRARLAG